MTDNQFWWANLHNHDHVEVVEVRFEDGKPHWVYLTGTDIGIAADEFDRCQVRLIERVLPAGRVAAVKALSDAMWRLLHDMGAEGTSVCHSAKASARIAYEPFRVDADGMEAPVDYPLEEAERTLEWIRDGLRHELSRPMTILPWSDEPVSPVIKVEDAP